MAEGDPEETDFADWIHVFPTGDLIEHVTSKGADCWCNPEVNWDEKMIVHRALDMREVREGQVDRVAAVRDSKNEDRLVCEDLGATFRDGAIFTHQTAIGTLVLFWNGRLYVLAQRRGNVTHKAGFESIGMALYWFRFFLSKM